MQQILIPIFMTVPSDEVTIETKVQVRSPRSNFHTTQHEEEGHREHASALQSASSALTLCKSLASYQKPGLIFTLEYKLVQYIDCGTPALSSNSACLDPTMCYGQGF